MQWDAPPIGRAPRSAPEPRSERQLVAKRRFEVALEAVGPGLAKILWRVAQVVLSLALERLADHHRLR